MDTKVFKAKNNESGTFTATLSAIEVGTANVTPVPQNAPGVIVAEIGTSKEEHIYYKSRDAGAGTISGLTRDYTNLNGGVGQEHVSAAAWETAQASEYLNNLVDAIQQGYHQEMNTIAYVSATQFTVATDQTSLYTVGRILRFNQDNTKIGIVSASSYGAGLTTVTIDYGTVPATLTSIEMAVMPKGATNLSATSSAVQKNSYGYAADAGSTDDYTVTLSPAPTAYTTGMVIVFKANTANTGSCTLNVNSVGAKALKIFKDQDPPSNYIKAGSLVVVAYDGTNFQIQSVAGIPVPKVSVLTDAANIATNAALGNYFTVTLAGNRTMDAPTNPTDGQTITYELKQDSTGSRLITWSSLAGGFSFGAGSAPTLSTTASKVDLIGFRYSATVGKWLYLGSQLGF